MSKDRFVLVHYDQIANDPRFDGIRDDDRLLGRWLRLLWLADAMWPLPAPRPVWATKAALAPLTKAGLIEEVAGHQYKVHGLDRERQRRAAKGKAGAAARWGNDTESSDAIADANASPIADANANANAMHAPPSPSPSPSQPPSPEGGPGGDRLYLPDGDCDALDVYHDLTMYRPWGAFSGDKLKDAIGEYGNEAVEAALRATHAASADRNTLLDRTLARLARDADHAREAARRTPKAPRAKRTPEQEARYQETRRRMAGLPVEGGVA